jgi:hypothetical protein
LRTLRAHTHKLINSAAHRDNVCNEKGMKRKYKEGNVEEEEGWVANNLVIV